MVINLSLQKHIIRKEILIKRIKLSKIDINNKSGIITKKILDLLPVYNKKHYLIYLPIDNEVNTKKIIDNLLKLKKKIFLPAFSKKTKTWIVHQFIDWKKIEVGPFNILQPVNSEIVNMQNLDIALIPGVAFDQRGNRLGYGKGVYDKLLADCNALRIGLAYDFQLVGPLPTNKHDLRMDMIVTEKRL